MTLICVIQALLSTSFLINYSFSHGLYEYVFIVFLYNIFQYVLSTVVTGESTSKVTADSKGCNFFTIIIITISIRIRISLIYYYY